MATLKQIIYCVGESKEPLTTRQIASKLYIDNVDKESKLVQQLIYEYKRFFSTVNVSGNPKHGKKHTLSANGRRFFERIVLTYDPITGTQLLPQDNYIMR